MKLKKQDEALKKVSLEKLKLSEDKVGDGSIESP